MATKMYNKLVRDRIPEIISARGAVCETEILSDAAYLSMLDAKLEEELAEYKKDQNLEELADLLVGEALQVQAQDLLLEGGQLLLDVPGHGLFGSRHALGRKDKMLADPL